MEGDRVLDRLRGVSEYDEHQMMKILGTGRDDARRGAEGQGLGHAGEAKT
jgi:hypothetical protein